MSSEDREDFIRAAVTVIFGVCSSVRLIIAVLKSVAKKCLVKTEDLHASCGYSDIWSVWFSGTVVVTCGGNQ
jgi:hypothetical protein